MTPARPHRRLLRTAPFVGACVCSLIALGLVASGCAALAGPSELEQAIATEQAAIKAYSTKVPAADELQKGFIDAWAEANEIQDVKAYREALDQRVVPALKAYVDAITAIPTSSAELERIHTPVVAAYTSALEAFEGFVDGLTEANVEERYSQLLETVEAVGQTQATYVDGLETYFASNRVRLVAATP